AQQEPLTYTLKPIYADFVFKEQAQALAFAKLIVERDWTAGVAYAPERGRWLVTVRRQIHPVFRDITIWLMTLAERVAMAGGESDGWGHPHSDDAA
ncbi:MAG TPA: ribonuclease E inhibitor RraB, partial [Verrucomicrobiae bacterium]